MSKNLELKSISELLENIFYIPSYQRGYKWDSRQVEDLLEDIAEFANKKNKKDKEFYCLQPVVVKNDNEVYRVIDGQQRLTTIFIILKYFNEVEFKRPKPVYSISYETRNTSHDYLESLNLDLLKEPHEKWENIDYYFFHNAFQVINNWFDNQVNSNPDFIQEYYPVLISSVKVIWYEITDENEIDVFTRLNIGKIPLTNAELIKALFMLNIKDDNEKLLMASQWDEIEYRMQDNSFFSFINNGKFSKPTRIEFIFDLIATEKKRHINIENLRDDDDKKSFYIFNELINCEEDSKQLWDEVKTYYRIFDELYNSKIPNDNKIEIQAYYHLVGFLTHTGESIQNIITDYKNNTKKEFLAHLKKRIRKVIFKKNILLNELNYEEHYKDVTNILFLFNVISTMNGGYSRYPFDKHYAEKWSLEHIHAQNSEDIKDDKDRTSLLKSELDYIDLKQSALRQRVQQMIDDYESKTTVTEDDFIDIQNKIFSLYSNPEDISLHTIDNLALLSRDDNSVLNNSIFPAKRDKIKELDTKGSFIPIGTKNVFLKYYSDDVKEGIRWGASDRKSYLAQLQNTLKDYMEVEETHE